METLREHSYAKTWEQDEDLTKGGEEAMDTTPIANADDIIVNVTQLDKNHDTYETLLLELLKLHSREQPCHHGDNELQITPESLDALSMEQIQKLVTSSSVNYQTVQHVLKLKLKGGSSPEQRVEMPNEQHCNTVGTVSEISGHSPSPSSTSNSMITNGPLEQSSTSSLSSSSGSTVPNGPVDNLTTNNNTSSGTGGGNSTVSSNISPTPRTPSISIKISPDQLKHLQSQIAEVFRQQNLQLPEGLSAEQKQIVLNSLIAQQLNASLQQLIPGAAVVNPPTSSSPGHKGNTGGVSVGTPSSAELTNSSTKSPLNKQSVSISSSVANNTGTLLSPGPPPRITTNAVERPNKILKVDDSNKKKKDPDAKRPPTAFNIFFSEMYPIVQEQQSNLTFSEASKMVAGLWSGLGQDGKQKYYEKCEQIRNDFNSRHTKETTPTKDPPTPNSSMASEVKSPPTLLSPTTKSPGRRPGSHARKQSREKVEGMCFSEGCYNMALPDTEGEPRFCSNECVVNHSKILFHSWITQRRLRT